MVSVPKNNAPALRFDKYSQPWRVTKNNHIFVPTDERGFAGLTVLSATQKDGLIPRSLLGKDISYNKDAEKIYKRVLPGDFAIHLRSFQGSFAHSKYEGITSPAYTTFRLRQASQHDDLFWKYFFISQSFIQSLIKVTYGIRDGRSIGAEEYFLEDSCFPPTPEEQRAIGELFADLDALIEQHRAKHTNLQQTKTALMQRMFPQDGADEPELRLGGFIGAWEPRIMRDCAEYSKGNGYSKKDIADEGTPVIHYGRLYTNYETAITDVDTFASPQPGALISRGDEVLVPASGETAEDIAIASALLQSGVLIGGDLNVIRPRQNIDPVFLALSLSHGMAKETLVKRAQGKSVVHLRNSDIQEVEILFPSLEEQGAIGEVFTNLDALIAAEHRYITQLTQAKTALLQRMFV